MLMVLFLSVAGQMMAVGAHVVEQSFGVREIRTRGLYLMAGAVIITILVHAAWLQLVAANCGEFPLKPVSDRLCIP